MRYHAVSSYVPGSKYHNYHWPKQGPVDRATVIDGISDLTYFKVLALPCKHPDSLHWTPNARWAVIATDEADYVENQGIVDFRRGEVIFVGKPREACEFLQQRGLPVPSSILDVKVAGDWSEGAVGNHSIVVAGYEGRAVAGDHGLARVETGTALAGDYGLASAAWDEARAGHHGVAFVQYEGSVSAGDFGVAVGGELSEAAAGCGGIAVTDTGGRSIVTDGRCALSSDGQATNTGSGCAIVTGGGDATSGDHGLAIVWSDSGTREEPSRAIAGTRGLAIVDGSGYAKAGDRGIALAGVDGSASAGIGGTIMVQYWDQSLNAQRVAVGYIDGQSLRPNVAYRVNDHGEFIEAVSE